MSDDMPALLSGLSSTLLAIFGILILALCLAFGWYQWHFVRAYRHFPSTHTDTKWFWRFMTGSFRKGVPLTSTILQDFIGAANSFLAEGLCVVWFYRPYIFVYGEEFTKTLSNEIALGDKPSIYSINDLLVGNGLLSSKHDVWKVHRKFLNPAFNLSVLKGRMGCFNASAHRLTDKLQTVVDKPVEDVVGILKYCAFHVMAESVLGLQLNKRSDESLAEDCLKATDLGMEQFAVRIAYPWLYWNFLLPFFRAGRKYLEPVNEGNRLIRIVIKQLRENVVASEKNERLGTEEAVIKSAGHALIRRHLQDPRFTEQDVRDHLVSFAVGGYDTVSVTMMWCLYLLGHNQDVQQKAYEEVESVVPDGDLTYEDISSMKYLDSVLKETLRMYSTVPIYGRKASAEIQCGKYTIPKGAEIVFFSFLLHRNPNIYAEPKKFDPDRFAEGSKIRAWEHVPFAEGYRSCIGKKFAMMEMKVLLAHVLRRFKITALNVIDDSELDWMVVLKPITPVRLRFETRHSQL